MPHKSDTGRMTPEKLLIKTKHFIVLLFALTLTLYGNTLSNGYSLDDDFVILHNKTVQQGFDGIGEILTSHYSENEKSRYEYRPLVKISFAIEYELFGLKPGISHFINLLLYFLTLILIYRLLLKLFPQQGGLYAIITTLIFAVHPLHTEVVASLKNRDELLSFMFSMLSANLLIDFVDRKKWYLLPLSLLVYVFAFYSKSSALVFAALIPLIVFFYAPHKWRLALIIIVVGLLTAYFLRQLPKEFLPKGYRQNWFFENPLFEHRGLLFRFGTGLVAILFYIRLLIFPHPLRFYYGYDTIPLTRFPDFLSVVALIILLALFVFAIWHFRKRHILSFAILFFFIAISMFSNILKPAMGIVAERYVYAASLGFCIALAWVLVRLWKADSIALASWKSLPRPLTLVLTIVLIAGGIRTITRNNDWKSTLSLFYADIPYLGNSFKANLILANTLLAEATDEIRQPNHKRPVQQYAADAKIYFQQAVQIYPDYANAWNSYGALYYMIYRDFAKAIPLFKKALSLNPVYTEAAFNMGFCYQQLDNQDSARLYFNRTLKIDSAYSRAYTQLGILALKDGDTVSFMNAQQRMINALPHSDEPFINLGNFYMSSGDTIKGITNWEKAADLAPDNPALMLNLANYYLAVNNNAKYQHYNQLYRDALKSQKEHSKR